VMKIFGRLSSAPLQLWIAVGFCATDGRQLLLDADRSLMTSSLGLDARLVRSGDRKEAMLSLPSETAAFLQRLAYGDPESAGDSGWSGYAVEALAQISVMDYMEYSESRGVPGPFGIALFDVMAGKWQFGPDAGLVRH
jgi:hypothetical protein